MNGIVTILALAAAAASLAATSSFALQGKKVLKDKSHEWRGILETFKSSKESP